MNIYYFNGTLSRYFSTKNFSGNILSISQINGLQPLSKTSFVRSPPLRQIKPFTDKFSPGNTLVFFNKGLVQFQRSFSGATALDTTVSNFLFLMSSARECCTVRFFRPIVSAIDAATFNFLLMLSTKWNLAFGKNIANGKPGNPPPVPRSITSAPSPNSNIAAIAREC